MRHIDELKHVHLIHSIMETIITLVIIVSKMINTRMSCGDVQVAIQRLQRFDPIHDPQLRAVWTWMWLLLAAGVVKIVFCILCFIVLHQLAHLGWTILSNQACILIMKLLDDFYKSRVQAAVNLIKQDQLKVG